MQPILAFTSGTRTYVIGLLRVGDALVVFLAGLISYWIRHGHMDMPVSYMVAVVMGTLLTINYHLMAGLYEIGNLRGLARQFGPLTVSWSAVIVTLIALAYFTKTSDQFSRVWATAWLGMNMIGFLLIRLWLAVQLESWYREGKLKTNLAIIGVGDLSENLARRIHEKEDSSIELVGIFDDRPTRTSQEACEANFSGTVEDLLDKVRENSIDEVIVALHWNESERLKDLLTKLNTVPVNVRLCPEVSRYPFPARGYSILAGIPMLDVFEPPLSGWNLIEKTVEDYVLATIFLILCLPFMAVIAGMIKLDSRGPVLFRQSRYGFNNNEFTVYKFRTMRVQETPDPSVPQAGRNDPRVTRVGAFLRRTSLDELPQLFNVLRGHMSIVGPRPHAVVHNQYYSKVINEYLNRHKVKPGITGWAQINGLRGETDTPEKMQMRVRYDLFYIDHWSLLFDLRIIFLTPFVALIHPNAY